VERIGSTHTFSSDRGIRIVAVLALAVMLVIVCAVTIAHGTQGGFNVWVKIAFIVIFVVPSAWFAVRLLRLGVEISSGRITVRNLWRTRVIAINEIRGIILAVKSGHHPGTVDHWVPRIDLTNADSIWMRVSAVASHPARQTPSGWRRSTNYGHSSGFRRQAQVTINKGTYCESCRLSIGLILAHAD
jgi:hypothetical protein